MAWDTGSAWLAAVELAAGYFEPVELKQLSVFYIYKNFLNKKLRTYFEYGKIQRIYLGKVGCVEFAVSLDAWARECGVG